jgi:hypothetical protein
MRPAPLRDAFVVNGGKPGDEAIHHSGGGIVPGNLTACRRALCAGPVLAMTA